MTKCLLRWKSVCFNWTTMLPKSVMMCSRFAYLLKSSNLKTRDVPRKRRKSRLAKDPAAQITGQKCIFLLLLLLMLTISKEQLGRKGWRSQGRRDWVMGSQVPQPLLLVVSWGTWLGNGVSWRRRTGRQKQETPPTDLKVKYLGFEKQPEVSWGFGICLRVTPKCKDTFRALNQYERCC